MAELRNVDGKIVQLQMHSAKNRPKGSLKKYFCVWKITKNKNKMHLVIENYQNETELFSAVWSHSANVRMAK